MTIAPDSEPRDTGRADRQTLRPKIDQDVEPMRPDRPGAGRVDLPGSQRERRTVQLLRGELALLERITAAAALVPPVKTPENPVGEAPQAPGGLVTLVSLRISL